MDKRRDRMLSTKRPDDLGRRVDYGQAMREQEDEEDAKRMKRRTSKEAEEEKGESNAIPPVVL